MISVKEMQWKEVEISYVIEMVSSKGKFQVLKRILELFEVVMSDGPVRVEYRSVRFESKAITK